MSTTTANRLFEALSNAERAQSSVNDVDEPYFPSLDEFSQMDRMEAEAYAYRLVADHCSDLITLLRADGEIIYASRNSHDPFGWKLDDLVGENLYELFNSQDINQLAEKLEHQQRTEVRCRICTSDGEWRWVRLQCKARGANDVPPDETAMLALLTDIDDQVKLEESAEQAKEALLEAERVTALSSLAGAVGHEIGNPLTAALGNLQLLENRLGGIDVETNRALAALDRSLKRIRKITDEVKLLADPHIDEAVEIDLASIVERVHLLTSWLDGTVERRIISAHIVADRSKLYQLVYNLFITHLQALTPEQDEPIRITCEPCDGGVVFEIRGTRVASDHPLRVDLLQVLRGKGVDFAIPLQLAESITLSLGGEWHAERQGDHLITRATLPRRPGSSADAERPTR